MLKSTSIRKTFRMLHVWLAGVGLSAALAYQLSAVAPWLRFILALLITSGLNVILSRKLPAVTAWIFVRRWIAALCVISALLVAACVNAASAINAGVVNWPVVVGPAALSLPLAAVSAYAFRQAFARAAGPRDVGVDWLLRRAQANWLLTVLIAGLPTTLALRPGYLVAVAIVSARCA